MNVMTTERKPGMVRVEAYFEGQDIHLAADPEDGREDRKFLELPQELIDRYTYLWIEWDDLQSEIHSEWEEVYGSLPTPTKEPPRENTLKQEIDAMVKTASELGVTPGQLLDKIMGVEQQGSRKRWHGRQIA